MELLYRGTVEHGFPLCPGYRGTVEHGVSLMELIGLGLIETLLAVHLTFMFSTGRLAL